MSTRDRDDLEPLRTRGSLPVRPAGPVRGALRTRSTVRVRGAVRPLIRQVPLDVLVQQLRQQVRKLPVTTVVHGWISDPAQAFLALLVPHLRGDDPVWLVPEQDDEPAPKPVELEAAVILDPRRDTDRRTYHNLITDMLFYPGRHASEGFNPPGATRTAAGPGLWERRTRALILDGRGPHADAHAQAGCQAGLMTYLWKGGRTLEEV